MVKGAGDGNVAEQRQPAVCLQAGGNKVHTAALGDAHAEVRVAQKPFLPYLCPGVPERRVPHLADRRGAALRNPDCMPQVR